MQRLVISRMQREEYQGRAATEVAGNVTAEAAAVLS
jgi:hypothetical protein